MSTKASNGKKRKRTTVGSTSAVRRDLVDLAREDGERWRKYGEKMVRGAAEDASEDVVMNQKSYYKCLVPGCKAKKTTSIDGRTGRRTAAYRFEHSHPEGKRETHDDGDDAKTNGVDGKNMLPLKKRKLPSTVVEALTSDVVDGDLDSPPNLIGVKFFAHLRVLKETHAEDAAQSDEGKNTSSKSKGLVTMLQPVRVLAMTPENAAHLKRLLRTRAVNAWASAPSSTPPPSAAPTIRPVGPRLPPPIANQPKVDDQSPSKSRYEDLFVEYGVFKAKAAMKVKCVKPRFESSGGVGDYPNRTFMKRAGGVVLEIANAIGPRQYDWSTKASFMLSPTEAAELAERIAANAGCSFFHDPGAGSSLRGAVNKTFRAEPMPDGSGGLFINISVVSSKDAPKGEGRTFYSLPVSYGEGAALRHLLTYLVPRIMGFSELFHRDDRRV